MSRPSKIDQTLRKRRVSRLVWLLCAVALFVGVTYAAFEVYQDYERDAHTGRNHDRIVLTPH